MAKSIPILLILSISSLLVLSSATTDLEDNDDIAFLESEEQNSPSFTPYEDSINPDFENYDDLDDSDFPDNDEQYESQLPTFDEKDVTVLTAKNFSEVVGANKYVMVEFYAPWCGHCQALAPEYAAAASELKGEAVLAKVDATEETELAQRFDVQGFPTVVFFVDGAKIVYQGGRDKDAIITWVKKKTGPSVYNITTTKEAEQILSTESRLVLAFLDSLVGPESEELDAASKLEDEVKFYQTTCSEVAKLFHIEPQAKRPSLVLLKKDSEKLNPFDGQFSKQRIAEFVSANKIPLVITLSRETAPLIFQNPIKKQLLLFAPSTDSEKFVPTFKEVAKLFKGKLVFVYVQTDEEDSGKQVAEYFGVPGDAPKLLAYTGNEDERKYLLDAEITFSNIKAFADDFLEDKLKPFYKSGPVPERNDGDVKVVVGNNFDEIVLDESKDVLLEIYAPWCGHCQALEPTYNKLGKYLRGIDSLVIAKMDGSGNEHPRAKPDGFPTILFFPAGNKSFDPITFDSDRTVVEFYKFLKKHASIPFKLQIPASKRSKNDASESQEIDNDSVKDEL